MIYSRFNITFKPIFYSVFFLLPLFFFTTSQASTHPYLSSHGINFAIGNKVHTETDISISGPVNSLSFTRTYNNKSTTESVLGYGWSWSFGEQLLIDSQDDTTIIRVLSSGRHIRHNKAGEGIWTSLTSKKTTITLETSGDYILSKLNGTVHNYDAQGKLTQSQKLNGYTRHYSYNGTTGELESVSDNFGRTLSFSYYATTGNLETLTTPAGDFTFHYDGNNNLTQVDRPDTTYRQYLYNDLIGNDLHNLTSVNDEMGTEIMSVVYDASDRVEYAYKTNGTEEIHIQGYGSLNRKITDALGNDTDYKLAIKHGVARIESFNTDNPRPVCSVCPGEGNDSSYTYNDRNLLETSTNGRSYVTQYGHDTDGNRTTVTEAFGVAGKERTTETAYYTGTSRVHTVTRDSVANTGQQTVVTWIYDASGNPDLKTETGYEGSTALNRGTDFDFSGSTLGRISSLTARELLSTTP